MAKPRCPCVVDMVCYNVVVVVVFVVCGGLGASELIQLSSSYACLDLKTKNEPYLGKEFRATMQLALQIT